MSMRINDDFSRPVVMQGGALPWVASPVAGVERRMLFRIGGEVARATSLVRYAPGSVFPRHEHGGGEEILVLDGLFQDEHGDYPAGSYFRNPPGSAHVPASGPGCVIFVKLWQFRAADARRVVRRPGEGERLTPGAGMARAVQLFDDGYEDVRLENWLPGARLRMANEHGLELLVLSGEVALAGELLGPQGWARFPAGSPVEATAGPSGAALWLKRAPLSLPGQGALPG
ncbi:cupin domain-containing protein [Acidocella sp.]|uniref:cupin domain-containing protein n=1 Tax=Acidocella sp. TaxID=50710 RepID=UPI00260519BC|nr:cupin domain-containing protein [Acidocella sp.]